MDSGFCSKIGCTKAERWSKVKTQADVKELELAEFQIFTHHAMECPFHESLLDRHEEFMISHLEKNLTADLMVRLVL